MEAQLALPGPEGEQGSGEDEKASHMDLLGPTSKSSLAICWHGVHSRAGRLHRSQMELVFFPCKWISLSVFLNTNIAHSFTDPFIHSSYFVEQGRVLGTGISREQSGANPCPPGIHILLCGWWGFRRGETQRNPCTCQVGPRGREEKASARPLSCSAGKLPALPASSMGLRIPNPHQFWLPCCLGLSLVLSCQAWCIPLHPAS